MKSIVSLFTLSTCAIILPNTVLGSYQDHAYDFKIEYLKTKHNFDYQKSHTSHYHNLKRAAVASPQEEDPQQQQPSNFLPPPWSPSSKLDSPYPPSGVTPWDDSGRSQVLDNPPWTPYLWRQCPQANLDCAKCPRDTRCRRAGSASSLDPPTNIHNIEDAISGTLTSPTTTGISRPGPDDATCPLTMCDETDPFRQCGANSKCVSHHCVCKRGYKSSAARETTNVRGYLGLQAVTVWVDPQWGCDSQCDDLSCVEVEQVEGCFPVTSKIVGAHEDVGSGSAGWEEDGGGASEGVWEGEWADTSNTGGGAVQVPGVDIANMI